MTGDIQRLQSYRSFKVAITAKPPIAEATSSGTASSPSFGRKLNLIVKAKDGSFVCEKLLIGSVKNEPRIDRFLSRKIK